MRIFMAGAGYSHWGNFHPADLTKEDGVQVGGGETAMIKMAEGLAARDHEVFVFANVQPCHWNGVDYLPVQMWVAMGCTMQHHVAVSWDLPEMLRFNLACRAKVVAYQLNHAYVGVLDHVIDRYFCPSEWHARRYQTEVTPEATAAKFRPRMTNAVDVKRYRVAPPGIKRNPWGVVWSSSPDRGLHHLLNAWSLVKQKQPKARLDVFYEMQKWFDIIDGAKKGGRTLVTTERADQVREGLKACEGLDVTVHGGVSQTTLAKAQLAASVGVASLDVVAPTEGFGMTMLEYLAAGLSPIAGAIDAFPELWASCATLLEPPQEPEVLVAAVLAAFADAPRARQEGPKLAKRFGWDILAKHWEREFEGVIG